MKFCPVCHSDRVFSVYIRQGQQVYLLPAENPLYIDVIKNTSTGTAKISHLLYHCDNCLNEFRQLCNDYVED